MSAEDFLEEYSPRKKCYLVYPLDNNSDGKLEKKKEMSNKFSGIYPFFAVRFYEKDSGGRVVGIGDGGRDNFIINGEKWNGFVKLVRMMGDSKELNAVIASLSLIGGNMFKEGRLERLIFGIKNKEIGEI